MHHNEKLRKGRAARRATEDAFVLGRSASTKHEHRAAAKAHEKVADAWASLGDPGAALYHRRKAAEHDVQAAGEPQARTKDASDAK